MPIRERDIYHIDDFPPLDGKEPKGRYVVVIEPPQNPGELGVIVVGITTKEDFNPERLAISIPSLAEHPACTTGLREPSWALPEWVVMVNDRLFEFVKNRQPLNLKIYTQIHEAAMNELDRLDAAGEEIPTLGFMNPAEPIDPLPPDATPPSKSPAPTSDASPASPREQDAS